MTTLPTSMSCVMWRQPRCLARLLSAIALVGLSSCVLRSARTTHPERSHWNLRHTTRLDSDWRFHEGDFTTTDELVSVSYDDGAWEQVSLPHDYVLSGDYSPTNSRNHAYLPYRPAWYRKNFFIPASQEGRILRLDFQGVFRDSQIWLNGRFLGRHASGYTPFSFDITQLARYGAKNTLVVRVDPRAFEGWWYEGGGIYRHVYLSATAPLHVAEWGTYVVSQVPDGDQGADGQANVTIHTIVANAGQETAPCTVVSQILAPNGRVLRTLETTESQTGGGQHEYVQRTILPHPALWSLQSPNLYRLVSTVLQDGHPVDSTTTTFGIRTIRFDANRGFFLNGRHIEIHGTANHQDFAGVGIAVPDSLQVWRVRQLKSMGCNAWRTAHNPPNVALLDACDRLGMLVMDENRHLGDSYMSHSPKGTTSDDLSDLAVMIQRDRNHPSIIMWSMCNEEGLQGTPEGAAIFSAMIETVHKYDRTRPITCAMNAGWLKPGIADVEDIIGVNYNYSSFDAIHERHPSKPMFGSEDTNQKTTRGQYVNDRAHGMSSCYNLSEAAWLPVVHRSFMAGSFTWTGFDYKGEPNPYGWPDVSNNTGLMDVCGFPKDKYYYFESCWSDKPMVHLMPDGWNPSAAKEGQTIRVLAFSNAQRVELFLNGRSLGSRTMPRDSHVEWAVPYQPGRLRAVAYSGRKVVATEDVQTTGAPARIKLSPERTTLKADGEDTVVVPVSILDTQGRVVPDADDRVTFHLSGDGQILGTGNGNPADHDSDKLPERKAFHGRCIALVQAGSAPTVLRLSATAPGLSPASMTFKVR